MLGRQLVLLLLGLELGLLSLKLGLLRLKLLLLGLELFLLLSGGNALAIVARDLRNRFAAVDVALPRHAGRAEAAHGVNARHFFVAGEGAAEVQTARLTDVLPAVEKRKKTSIW